MLEELQLKSQTVPLQGIAKIRRESSVELFRILLMLCIVAHHGVMNDACWSRIDIVTGGVNDLILLCMGAWGKVGINCFVLITGYYMCRKSITLEKFLKLYLEVVFYRLVINACHITSGKLTLSPIVMIDTIFPCRNIADGFTGAFLLFFLFVPFLNILVRGLSRWQHLLIIALSVAVFSVLPSLPRCSVSSNYVEWFCVLYFIGSYLSLYPNRWVTSARLWGWLSVCMFGAGLFSVFLNAYILPVFLNIKISEYFWLMDCNRITALIPSICFFLCFKNMNLPYSRVVNSVAATTFGVLQIHANSLITQDWLWRDVCHSEEWVGSWSGLASAVMCVVAVFAVCSIADFVRISIIERPLFASWRNAGLGKNGLS